MDVMKIGAFLKELRMERNLTQEKLAEQLNVSNRTISRWETGRNMPDISMLVEIAEFYDVSIPEIINGERMNQPMNQETKETAAKMAEYSHHEQRNGKHRIMGYLLFVVGLFTILSALGIFPNESSWGSVYAVIGSLVLLTGLYFLMKASRLRTCRRIGGIALCALVLFGLFSLSDYIAVTQFHQVPRFRYRTTFDSRYPDRLIYKTLFFTAVLKDPGTPKQTVYIQK